MLQLNPQAPVPQSINALYLMQTPETRIETIQKSNKREPNRVLLAIFKQWNSKTRQALKRALGQHIVINVQPKVKNNTETTREESYRNFI